MLYFWSLLTLYFLVLLTVDVEGRNRVRAKSAQFAVAPENEPSSQPTFPRRQLSFQPNDARPEDTVRPFPHMPPGGSRIVVNPSMAQGGLQSQSSRPKSPQASVKSPPVQTIRNYNKINDDGSFTFGYEAEDGSFKEETRGVDCVVRGKYGYIDPDGNKREYTYVSGNPCDPNALALEEQQAELEDEEDRLSGRDNPAASFPEERPAAVPVPRRPSFVSVRPLLRQNPALRPAAPSPTAQEIIPSQRATPPRPAPAVTHPTQGGPISTTSTVASPTFEQRTQTEQQFSSTVRPWSVPTILKESSNTKFSSSSPTSSSSSTSVSSKNAVYSTELVYDSATGQYNTVVYQQVPKGTAASLNDASSIRQRLPATSFLPAAPPAQPLPAPLFFNNHSPQLRQFPQSTDYFFTGYPEQGNPLVAVEPKQFPGQYQQAVAPSSHGPFYFSNPTVPNTIAAGQIDSFLRQRNVRF